MIRAMPAASPDALPRPAPQPEAVAEQRETDARAALFRRKLLGFTLPPGFFPTIEK